MIWTLMRQAWTGKYQPAGNPGDAHCVLGFAFGGVQDGGALRPGVSNEDLANFALRHFAHLPFILQGEIADVCPPSAPATRPVRIDRHRLPGQYLDTREVAEQACEIMKQHGWQTAVLLAHPHHLPRVAAVCRRLSMGIVVPPGLDVVRFCPDSFQKWTRSRGAWIRRELPAILLYRWKGWI